MTSEETTILLGFIEGLDKRVALNERAISAWKNVLPSAISLKQAMRYVREHYQDSDKSVLPADIVGRYRITHTLTPAPKVERLHDCFDGFVIITEVTEKGYAYEAASPCPLCNTNLPKSDRLKSEREQ